MKYFILIIYEDGTRYEGKISTQKKFKTIPKNKAYEAIKICYVDNPKYCHIINGRDNVFLEYHDKCIYYSQFDDNEEFTKVIKLKGVGKEEIFSDSTDHLPKTFKGKLLQDEEYEKLRIQCEEWRPDQ